MPNNTFDTAKIPQASAGGSPRKNLVQKKTCPHISTFCSTTIFYLYKSLQTHYIKNPIWPNFSSLELMFNFGLIVDKCINNQTYFLL